MAASTLLGVTLVVLVAMATVAVALLVWARAEDRARVEDERAADIAREALQNSLGRVLTTLRGADGLVAERGTVDPASFRAFAEAVSTIPATGSLALEEVVTADERQRFEQATGHRIIEFVRTGVFRPAGERSMYLPIVEVWPPTAGNRRLIGLDLLSEPARRRTLTLARTTRQASFTELIPFAAGQQGLLAFKPLYASNDDGPIGYVSASFSTSVIANVLDRLPESLRVGVAVDGTSVYATSRTPASGTTRSLMLGGRRWVVTARGPAPSHNVPLAILASGLTLAALLAAFTRSRASFERRLVRASEAERDARERSELLERHASHLAAAATSRDVATSTVDDLSAAGIEIAAVYALEDGLVEVLATSGVSPESLSASVPPLLDADSAGAQAMRSGEIIEIRSGDEYDRRFPAAATRRRHTGVESVIAVPLRNTDGRVTGALVTASREPQRLNRSMRLVVIGVAEQCGLALERARLQSIDVEARRRADLLQRLTADLSAAALPQEVAEASIPYLFDAFGADLCSLGVASGDDVRTIKIPAGAVREDVEWLPVPLSTSTPTAEAIRTQAAIELHGIEPIARRYPPEVERVMRGIVSMLVVPLPRAMGAIGVAFAEHRVLRPLERQLLAEIAEELAQALERAALLERERDARLHAELMEQNAAHLAAATTRAEVAASTVADVETVGAEVVFVWRSDARGMLTRLASSNMREETSGLFYPDDGDGVVAEAMRTGRLVSVGTKEEHDGRYPAHADERALLGAESLAAVPLRAASGAVIGAIFAASSQRSWLNDDRRRLLLGVAEQTGVALERAELQADAEHSAATAAFLALVGEVVERPTRAEARARRLTDVLTDERATFAAVHLAHGDGPAGLTSISGSRPPELVDDDRWSELVARAIASRRPVSPEAGPQSLAHDEGPAVIIIPLRARGRTLGTLTLRTAADADWRPAIGPELAREIAARFSIALDNALLYEREREVSHSLQLGLLGGAIPSFDGVVVAAAYRPGTAALEVGGDWYDAFRLPSGALGLVVGDVVGHGLEAAVAMGQLRGALSALAQTGAPARILELLDSFVENVPAAATATIAYVELDPATGRIRYACAGHPPPLVVSPDGRTRYLWDGRSAPLGSTLGDGREEAVDVLDDGETLVLYTDGLVERRGASFDHGLAKLAAAAKGNTPGATTLADDLCEALLDGQSQDDDVCVLTLHRLPTVSMYRHAFPADPAELAGLRESLRMWLGEVGIGEEAERSTVLAVSEAAATAIAHCYDSDGAGIVTVVARLNGDERLDITVRDEGAWRDAASDVDRGRGLLIMQAIVDEFSIVREDGGTVLRMSRSAREKASA